jgi:hypothetical protein
MRAAVDPDHSPAEGMDVPRELFVLCRSREHESFKCIEVASARIIIPNYANFVVRVVMTVPVTGAQKAAYLKFLFEQIDKPYDYAAIWAFLFNRNWRRQAEPWLGGL